MAAALLPRESALRRLLPLLLLALGTASAAVALARPTVATQVPVQRASVMLVTDASGSMAAEDVAPTRLSAVQSAIARFLEGAPEQLRVGLLSYSSSVEAVQVPTTNHAAVRAASDALQPVAARRRATHSPPRSSSCGRRVRRRASLPPRSCCSPTAWCPMA